MPWINAEEVALMTVVGIFIFPVVEPLLQIPFLANLVGLKFCQRYISFSDEVLVYP